MYVRRFLSEKTVKWFQYRHSLNSPLTDHLSTKNWVSRHDSPLLSQAMTQLSSLLLIKDSKADGACISMEQTGLPIISKRKDRRSFDLFNNQIKCLLSRWCPGSPKRLIGMVVLVWANPRKDTNLRFCGTGQEIVFGFVLIPFQRMPQIPHCCLEKHPCLRGCP